ncbi:MAG: hypothetical protein AABX00_03120 [Nanoarchaeota archaeon]
MAYQTVSQTPTNKPSGNYGHVNTYRSNLTNMNFDIRVGSDGVIVLGFPHVSVVLPQRRADGSNVTKDSASPEDAAKILKQLLVMTGVRESPPLNEILAAEEPLIRSILSDLSNYRTPGTEQIS